MKRILFLLVGISILLMTGCGVWRESNAIYWATLSADGTFPPPVYQTDIAEYLGVRLTATPTPTLPPPPPVGTPTMSFYEFSGTQVAQQQSIALTSQANEAELERERLAAEERSRKAAEDAKHAEGTAQALRIEQTAEARATYLQGTANAEGTQVMNTAVAASTGTAVQNEVIAWRTATAFSATQAVQPTHAIWTQDAVYVIQTVEQGNAEKVALAVRRQETKNLLDALLPWALVIVALWVLARGLRKWLMQRVHPRDEHGRQPLLTVEDESGNLKIIKPETMPKSVVSISPTGAVTAYELTSEKEQEDINRRAQAVDALAVLPTPYAKQGVGMMNAEFGRSGPPRVNIGNSASGDMRSVLDEADSKLIEED